MSQRAKKRIKIRKIYTEGEKEKGKEKRRRDRDREIEGMMVVEINIVEFSHHINLNLVDLPHHMKCKIIIGALAKC